MKSRTDHSPAPGAKPPEISADATSADAEALYLPEEEREPPRFRAATLLLLLLALAVGAALGALVMRQRYRAGQVVVSVNGTVIHDRDFYHRLEGAAGAQVLRQMVVEEMELQYARKKGALPTESQIEARYAEAARQPEYQKFLAESHQTPDDIRRAIRLQLARAALYSRGQAVTEAAMRAYYRAQTDPKNPQARFYTPETITIAVIQTTTEAACRRALEALAGGMAFEEAARRYSMDQTRENGGVLPPFGRGRTASSRIPGLEEAVFGLEVGGQLGPRRFAGRWWIIRCLDKTPAVVRPFAQVREECRVGAMQSQTRPADAARTQADFAAFQKQSTVHVFWPQYWEAVRGR